MTGRPRVLAVDDRRENLLALLDVPGRLEAVHARHVGVEQDHREVVDQQLLQGVLAAADGDDLDGQPLQDRLQGHEVLAAVVHGQHPRSDARHDAVPGPGEPPGSSGTIHDAIVTSSSSRSTGLVT